jgi:predicted sulfurtransferase
MKNEVLVELMMVILLVLLLPMAGEGSPEEKLAYPEVPRITCEELKQLMDKEVALVLVDTRLESSFKRGYLKGAINVPDTSLSPITEEIIKGKLMMLPRDKLIVLYCD